ncbi:hypothetical protein CEXT_805411 [Caerostris extrusa]|uniref:Uncharacterized protein n=1 Tax=Caerostris extrusa TaxID=172846 RepID=A0AAV4W3E1_CAEEX|nr:hypothetical protein CEXT_805411 [Caerostris extrusa]
MKTLAMDPDDAISQDEHLVTLKVYIPDLLIQMLLSVFRSVVFFGLECALDYMPKRKHVIINAKKVHSIQLNIEPGL